MGWGWCCCSLLQCMASTSLSECGLSLRIPRGDSPSFCGFLVKETTHVLFVYQTTMMSLSLFVSLCLSLLCSSTHQKGLTLCCHLLFLSWPLAGVSLSVSLCLSLSVRLSVCLFGLPLVFSLVVCLSLSLRVSSLAICLSLGAFLFSCFYGSVSLCLSLAVSLCLSVYLSLSASVCLSLSFSVSSCLQTSTDLNRENYLSAPDIYRCLVHRSPHRRRSQWRRSQWRRSQWRRFPFT